MRAIIKIIGTPDQTVIDAVDATDDIEIIGFTSKNGNAGVLSVLSSAPVSSFSAVNYYKEGLFDAIIIPVKPYQLLERIVNELTILGVNPNDIYIVTPEFLQEHTMEKLCIWKKYSVLPYIEFHVADHCNLRCKGCVHFSPLVRGEKFADYEKVRRDFRNLKRIVSHIETIHILGGEPLLNPDLYRYIEMVKEFYPYTELSIVTNGMLVRSMPSKLIRSIQQNNVGISISLYPPLYSHMDKIIRYLSENNIKYVYSDPIQQFCYAFNKTGGMSNGVMYQNCTCPNLYEGKLYICPLIAYAKYFNEAFGDQISLKEGGIDLSDNSLTYERLKNELRQLVSCCDNCLYLSKEKEHRFTWQRTDNASISDYVLEE